MVYKDKICENQRDQRETIQMNILPQIAQI